MIDGSTMATDTGSMSKPPLDFGVRVRLSVMMLLQFAVWGAWFATFGTYITASTAEGGLGFPQSQVGSLYGTMALGAIISTMIAGQIADRLVASEWLMAICHLGGAALLYQMAHTRNFDSLWWYSLAYALLYNPTLSLSNSISFANIPDATRDFPTLRVLGTLGWIVAGVSIDLILPKGAAGTNKPLLMAAMLSGVLGVFSLFLPHTPPTGKRGDTIPFIRALKLLTVPSFGIFFTISFVITIALAFYYGYAGPFLASRGVEKIGTTMSIGQWSELGFMMLLPFSLKRLGMKWVLGVGMAAWAIRYGLFSIGTPMAVVLIGVALHGVCFDFFLAAGFIYTDEKAPASIRGSAQALFSFLVYGLGMWIGNVLSGLLAGHYTAGGTLDWRKFWIVPSIGAAVCLVVFLLIWRDSADRVAEV